MSIQDLIPEAEYAKARGVCPRTVQRERVLRIGAPFIRLGRKIYYRPEAINEWLLRLEKQPMQSATHSK